MYYTPFNRELSFLEDSDLQILIDNQISEGWYIEYKSQIPGYPNKPDTKKIAKSIASFANTKGGWIFWGIKCKENVASELSGD